jgi:heat-inducible transcriptional repressor
MSDLDARKRSILHAVIVEYLAGAEPVGSELLVQKYPLGVKAATVRNELAEMSDLGYLEQPHTSAGRIPSDLGYRYFVDRLIPLPPVDPASKQRVRSASEDGDALQILLRDTARILSQMTQLLSIATTLRDSEVVVRNAVVSALGPKQVLLVLVLSNGQVENRMLECPNGITLEDVGRTNDLLSQLMGGKTLRSLVRAKAPPVSGSAASDRMMSLIWSNIRAMARELTRGITVTEGEEFMLAQPEFQRDVHSLRDLLEALTQGDALYEEMQQPADPPHNVTIGREHRTEILHHFSVVRHSFFVGEQEAGVIAIIGPKRMHYERSIPLVNYTARALSQSLTRFFG